MDSTDKGKVKEVIVNDSRVDHILLSMQRIENELERVNSHKFVKIHNSIYQLLTFYFLKGIVFGLGSVLGATIVVSIVAYVLSQFEFVPIVGEWAKLVVEEMQK
ncbi:MAG: hypothetical protein COB30_012725 [Ectothiorhodospiraceae bacterium]|nr:hypothetical protein [Ectothiorhodospiraceae bacterium]